MSDKYFVDTNILVYAHDTSAGAKHDRAKALVEDLWRQGSGVVSTQVLQELCVNIRRKARHPADLRTAREIVTDYLSWDVVANTAESVLEALQLEEHYQSRSGMHSSFKRQKPPEQHFFTPKTYRMARLIATSASSTRCARRNSAALPLQDLEAHRACLG